MNRSLRGFFICAIVLVGACYAREEAVSWGDSKRGEQLIRAYGCGACHSIAGIQRANSKVGPALEKVKERVYIAGVIPNTPHNLMRWIEHPREIDSRTAMPDVGVTAADARDIAAYLYSH